MPATSSVSPSGDKYVDAILTGTKWATASLTFSFPSDASYYGSGYGSGEPGSNFAAFNSAQQAAVAIHLRNVFQRCECPLHPDHREFHAARGSSLCRDGQIYDGVRLLPYTSAEAGDAWFGNSSHYFDNPVKGNYAYFTIIHEIGHTLGLKHAHEIMGKFGVMPSDRDATEFTVAGPNSDRTISLPSTTRSLQILMRWRRVRRWGPVPS